MLKKATQILSNGYDFENGTKVYETYSSCVDNVDIWPPPYSILKPLRQYISYTVYVIKVILSHQVKFANLNKTYISFSISTINPLEFGPYYTKYSGKSLLAYFKVPNPMKYVR